MAIRKKVPYGLSRCHTKRRTGARGRARPSFGMTPTFQKKKKKKKIKILIFFFQRKNLKSWFHTKRRAGVATRARPSFGLTMTQDIRGPLACITKYATKAMYKKPCNVQRCTKVAGIPYRCRYQRHYPAAVSPYVFIKTSFC